MHVTVAICTWNRARLLEQTLDRLTALVIPDGVTWDVLLVENNCTDDTGAVAAAFAGRLPLRLVHEPASGKSRALNRVAEQATGEWILHTDDDVLVDPGWLTGYLGALQRHPDAVVLGGPIEPWFDGAIPPWLTAGLPAIGSAFAVLDPGPVERPITPDLVPFGANLAIRADVQGQFRYDIGLGPRPGSELRGEETTLVRTLLGAGLPGWWIPAARVRHFIPPERQTLRYVRAYYRGQGEFYARAETAAGAGRRWLGCPPWLWRRAATTHLAWGFHRVFSGPEAWVERMMHASIDAGRVAYYRRPTA